MSNIEIILIILLACSFVANLIYDWLLEEAELKGMKMKKEYDELLEDHEHLLESLTND